MTDTTTGQRLEVSKDGGAGPYIVAPEAQLDEVTRLLDKAGVPYWVDEEAISIDGKPEFTVVNFGLDSDPRAIQRVLDSAR
ncbi:MAG: hypothetical protein NTW86_06005 [Candidatus Sumerlaeota bacterium]|nr:hypothetical protein [Candidatus Sumerlaeota bacterium]